MAKKTRKLKLLVYAFLLLVPCIAHARTRTNGSCQQGGNHVTTNGTASSTFVQASSPGCLVTVTITGGGTLATLYADNNGTPLANPFNADSSTGNWFFYADDGHYDITLSGPGFQSPEVIGDVYVSSVTNNSIRLASQFPGSDCGAQINAADANLGSSAGEIWVDNDCGLSWTSPVVLSANHVLRFIQGGTYSSSASTMILMNSGTAVFGSTYGQTVLQSTLATGVTINTGSGASVQISNVTIQPSVTTTGGSCVSISSNNVILSSSYMFGCYDGVDILGGVTHFINSSQIRSFVHVGIDITGSVGEDHVTQVVMDNAVQPFAGIEITGTSGVWISDSDIIHCGIGLLVSPGSGNSVKWLFVSNTAFDSSAQSGIIIDPAGTGVASGLAFTGTWSSNSSENGVELSGTGTIDGVRFVNHRSFINGQAGIIIVTGTHIDIDSSDFAGNSVTTPGTYPGIDIAGGISNFSISDCRSGQEESMFPNYQNYGIVINNGSGDNFIVTSNNTQNNLTGGIFNGATGSHTVVANNL